MLQLVKGDEFNRTPTHEGFVSWYMERPLSLFAKIKSPPPSSSSHRYYKFPVGGPLMQQLTVWPVPIDDYPDFWRNYVFQRFGEGKPPRRVTNVEASKTGKKRKRTTPSSLASYDNKVDCVRNPERCDTKWTVYEHLLLPHHQEGLTRDQMAEVAPKIEAIVTSILDNPINTRPNGSASNPRVTG